MEGWLDDGMDLDLDLDGGRRVHQILNRSFTVKISRKCVHSHSQKDDDDNDDDYDRKIDKKEEYYYQDTRLEREVTENQIEEKRPNKAAGHRKFSSKNVEFQRESKTLLKHENQRESPLPKTKSNSRESEEYKGKRTIKRNSSTASINGIDVDSEPYLHYIQYTNSALQNWIPRPQDCNVVFKPKQIKKKQRPQSASIFSSGNISSNNTKRNCNRRVMKERQRPKSAQIYKTVPKNKRSSSKKKNRKERDEKRSPKVEEELSMKLLLETGINFEPELLLTVYTPGELERMNLNKPPLPVFKKKRLGQDRWKDRKREKAPVLIRKSKSAAALVNNQTVSDDKLKRLIEKSRSASLQPLLAKHRIANDVLIHAKDLSNKEESNRRTATRRRPSSALPRYKSCKDSGMATCKSMSSLNNIAVKKQGKPKKKGNFQDLSHKASEGLSFRVRPNLALKRKEIEADKQMPKDSPKNLNLMVIGGGLRF